jgi:protein gp37
MAENSNIEWTDHTFNPWEGCQKVGPGCDHCYAETRNARFSGGVAINWGPGAPRRRTSVANWRKPLAWNAAHEKFFAKHGRRQRVFCASLADVFDNAVPQLWRTALFALIHDTPNLDWLLLTKRIGNAAAMLQSDPPEGIDMAALPNLWLGATICNQAEADRDLPKLLAVPARVRFLSMEPLLGPVDLRNVAVPTEHDQLRQPWDYEGYKFNALQEHDDDRFHQAPATIDWVIAGGESGPGARPMHPAWVRSLRDQCAAAGVPYLFKQWGEWTPQDPGEEIREYDCAGVLPNGNALLYSQGYVAPFDTMERLQTAGYVRLDGRTLMHRVGKKAAGRLLDGVQHDGFPA